ncbi:MAG TPA: nucleotide exchange factor GrpE [Clostridiales bacterium]|nr:nucleotide exchange factor GrpE [Clostridiales bacterium]
MDSSEKEIKKIGESKKTKKEKKEKKEKDLEETLYDAEEISKDKSENITEDIIDKEEAEKDSKELKIEEQMDQLIRLRAEFENFRKRSEKEKLDMFSLGAKTIIEAILPVVDNFERGLSAVTEEEKENGFAKGVDMIYKQLINTLDGLGVKPIEAIGKEFNTDYHNAILQEESEEFEENIVSEEFQKGYTYNDKVIRYSMVKVAI